MQQLPGVLERTKRLLAKLQPKQADETATSVDLSEERITVKRLKTALASKAVKSLNLDGTKGVSDVAIATISEAQTLEELNLAASWARALDLTPLVRLKSLKTLELWNNQINDERAKNLGQLSSLEYLGLKGTGFADKHAVHLSKLTKLRRLDLDRRITDLGLRSISGLVDLEELSLDGAQITAEGLVHLARLKNLRSLRLDGADIGDDGVERLAKLHRLEILRLRGCGLTDKAFSSLVRIKRLKYLDLASNELTDKGFEHLPKLAKLEGIDLRGTQVTGNSAACLIKLPELKELLTSGTKFDRVGIQRVKHVFPNCKINKQPWHLSYGRT